MNARPGYGARSIGGALTCGFANKPSIKSLDVKRLDVPNRMYLNLIHLAESFGVSERVVEGWVRNEGLPHNRDRDRLLFDRAEVAEWAAARGLGARAGFLAPATPAFAEGCRIQPLLAIGRIWRNLAASEIPDVLDRVVDSLPGASAAARALIARRLRAPAGVTWSPIGGGFALPHPSARVALGRDSGALSLLLLRDEATQAQPTPDAAPVNRLVFFIAPSPRAHLELLGRLTRALAFGPLRDRLLRADDDDAIFAAAAEADAGAGASATRTLNPRP